MNLGNLIYFKDVINHFYFRRYTHIHLFFSVFSTEFDFLIIKILKFKIPLDLNPELYPSV